jgi:hypothetical protein
VLLSPKMKGQSQMNTSQSTYIGGDETGSVYLPTQQERTRQLYW